MAQDPIEEFVKKTNIWSCEELAPGEEYAFFNDCSTSSSNLVDTRVPELNESFFHIGTHTKHDDYYYVDGGYFPSGKVDSIIDNNTFISGEYTFIRKYAEVVPEPEVKPEHLYAYTDTNASSETLYAWTATDTAEAESYSFPATIYTNTATPTIESIIYDKDGNDITSTFFVGAWRREEVTPDYIKYYNKEK